VRLGIGRNTITRKIQELGIGGAEDDRRAATPSSRGRPAREPPRGQDQQGKRRRPQRNGLDREIQAIFIAAADKRYKIKSFG
jgi:hypothetical protein